MLTVITVLVIQEDLNFYLLFEEGGNQFGFFASTPNAVHSHSNTSKSIPMNNPKIHNPVGNAIQVNIPKTKETNPLKASQPQWTR